MKDEKTGQIAYIIRDMGAGDGIVAVYVFDKPLKGGAPVFADDFGYHLRENFSVTTIEVTRPAVLPKG